MNKRRRFKAKRNRKFFGGARAKRYIYAYESCGTCGDYIMACICGERTPERKISLRQFAEGARL